MLWEIRGTRNGKAIRAKVSAASEQSARAKAQASGVVVSAVTIFNEESGAGPAVTSQEMSAGSIPGEPDADPQAPTQYERGSVGGYSTAGQQPQPNYAAMPIEYAQGPESTRNPASAPFGLGLASVICGGIATIAFCLWFLAIPVALGGLTTGIVGWVLAKKRRTSHTLPMIGTFVSVIPFVIYLVVAVGFVGFFRSTIKAATLAQQRAAAQAQANAAAQAQLNSQATAPTDTSSPTTTSSAPDPVIADLPLAVAASDLIKAFAANPVAADGTYRNHWLIVDGTITQIHKTSIVLNAADKHRGIQCNFTLANASAVAGLQLGQTVTVKGRCTGGSPRSVNLRDATVVK